MPHTQASTVTPVVLWWKVASATTLMSVHRQNPPRGTATAAHLVEFLSLFTQLKRKESVPSKVISIVGSPREVHQTHELINACLRPFFLLKHETWHFPNRLQLAIFLLFRPKIASFRLCRWCQGSRGQDQMDLEAGKQPQRSRSLEVSPALSLDAFQRADNWGWAVIQPTGQPAPKNICTRGRGEMVWVWRRIFSFFFLSRRDKTGEWLEGKKGLWINSLEKQLERGSKQQKHEVDFKRTKCKSHQGFQNIKAPNSVFSNTFIYRRYVSQPHLRLS